jgi:hypothetical protein
MKSKRYTRIDRLGNLIANWDHKTEELKILGYGTEVRWSERPDEETFSASMKMLGTNVTLGGREVVWVTEIIEDFEEIRKKYS